MKAGLLFLFILCTLPGHAQDQLYLLDGRRLDGKVLEINPENIVYEREGGKETIEKHKLLLIAFGNGMVEHFNQPAKNIVYHANTGNKQRVVPAVKEISKLNLVSVNTLAMVNSDLSFFYERLSSGRKFGAGAMAAYNFNQRAQLYNPFFFILNNAKKNYDAGVFLNIYTGNTENKRSFWYGIMFKYTSFSFSSMRQDTVVTGNSQTVNLTFTPATGSQLATIFTMGTHYRINEHFFIKTIYGLGGFNLKGVYRQQYNYLINQNLTGNTAPVNIGFLLKLYFGVNAGFNL